MANIENPGALGSSQDEPDRLLPRRWLAVLFSLLCPGSGQLYCGFPKRALAISLGQILSLLLAGMLLARAPKLPAWDWSALAFPFFVQLLATWDAWRCARKPDAHRFRFLPVLAFILLVTFLPCVIDGKHFGSEGLPVRSYYIPSGSMDPTLRTGDYILVRMVSFEPKLGEIVVFEPPDHYPGGKEHLVDRIVAVGGDVIEVKDGALFLNGAKQTESYIKEPMGGDFASYRVPPGHYFMMGDNRNDSFDSRYWHAVPRDHLKGRVMSVFWSRQSGRAGLSF